MDSTDKKPDQTAAELARKAQTGGATKDKNDPKVNMHKEKVDNLGMTIIKAALGRVNLKNKRKQKKKANKKRSGGNTRSISQEDQVKHGDKLVEQEEKRLLEVEPMGNFFAGDGFAMKKEEKEEEKEEHVEKPGENVVKKEKRIKKPGEKEEHVDKDGEKEVKKEKHVEKPGEKEVKKPEDLKAKTKRVDNEGGKNVEKTYADVGAHTFEAEKDTKKETAAEKLDQNGTPKKIVETDVHQSTRGDNPKKDQTESPAVENRQHDHKDHSDADKKKDAKIGDH